MQTFELKKEHLDLLKKAYVGYNDYCEYGAPCIDPKRPYGNSDVEKDIAEILQWGIKEDEELSDSQMEEAYKLHKETQIALQIVLRNIGKEIKLGTYTSEDYGVKWKYKDKE